MQELQEERRKLQILEQASNSNLSIDRTGNLITSSQPESTGPGNNINDAMTAALIAAEEQAAVASGRRLRRRDEKGGEQGLNGLPSATGNGVGSTVIPSVPTISTQSRRKQVNNIYTYSKKSKTFKTFKYSLFLLLLLLFRYNVTGTRNFG